MSLNNVILTGRTTADIEVKMTSTGKKYCDFSIAVDQNVKDKPAYFFNCRAWSGLADTLAIYVKKGSLIGVSGSLVQSSYVDSNNIKRNDVKINVANVSFENLKNETGSVPQQSSNDYGITDDDLPY